MPVTEGVQPDPVEPLLSSVSRSAKILAVSPDTIRRMIVRGDLPVVRIGSRVLVPTNALSALATAR